MFYADVFEQVGIDEAYLDVTQKTHGSFGEAKLLAEQMKDDVNSQVGVTFSIGIGQNKLMAKVAADARKPDGLTIVLPETVKEFLSPLPAESLIGIGKKISKKMNAMGIKTINDLARYDVQRLVVTFGKALGVYFHNAANGVDDTPVAEASEAESISRIATLKEDSRDLAYIFEKLGTLIDDVFDELGRKRLSFKQVGIIAVLKDLTIRNRSLTLEQPTRSLEALIKTSRGLLERLLDDADVEIRRIGVKVSQLSKEQKVQKQLVSFFES